MNVIKEILTLYVERADWFAELLLGHIALALTAIALSGTIGLLIGVLISEHQRIASPIMGICNVLYTNPVHFPAGNPDSIYRNRKPNCSHCAGTLRHHADGAKYLCRINLVGS